jgi:hypothetical protein
MKKVKRHKDADLSIKSEEAPIFRNVPTFILNSREDAGVNDSSWWIVEIGIQMTLMDIQIPRS